MPTTVYADTSAIAKLFIAEPEAAELRGWLGSLSELRLVSSALLPVELLRLLRLVNSASVPLAEGFLTKRHGHRGDHPAPSSMMRRRCHRRDCGLSMQSIGHSAGSRRLGERSAQL
jgi:hypothetical protein